MAETRPPTESDALELLRRLEQATADGGEGAGAEPPELVQHTGEELWAMLNEDLEADSPEVRSRETRMRARFYRELALFEAAPAKAPSLAERADRWLSGFWPSTRVAQAGFAAFTLLVGLGLGLTARRESDLYRLQREMSTMGQTVALALLDHSAATERLRGVSLGAAALEGRDDDAALAIADGLLEVVSYDSSENVRLAAVEALARIADRPRVRAGLVDALARQDSPMVQMTLADVVVSSGDSAAQQALRSLLERDDLEPAVRQRFEELLRAANARNDSRNPAAQPNPPAAQPNPLVEEEA
jgi:hypothetical protein